MDDAGGLVMGGTVQAGDGLYLCRRADQELLALCQAGAFAYILAARQIGKSSLMVATADRLREAGIQAVIVDLQGFGVNATAEQWYLGLLDGIAGELPLQTDVLTWWEEHAHLGMTRRLTLFFEEVLLAELQEPVVVFVDEIDTTLSVDFADDFYTAIRYLYNARAENPIFRRLSFVLIGVASPGDLIRDPRRTPFNIGQRVELLDWTYDEAAPLVAALRLPDQEGAQVLRWVLEWTGGHPYLTQRLCHAIAAAGRGSWSQDEVARVVEDTFFGELGAKDNNLQFVRDMLTIRATDPVAVLTTYAEVRLGERPVADDEQSLVKSHLKLSGVVQRREGALHVRNRIYARAFDAQWVGEQLPLQDLVRQARAWVASAAGAPEQRDEGLLLRGAVLEEAQRWLDEHNALLSQELRDFIRAGVALRDRLREEERRREAELVYAQALAEEQRKRAEAERERAEAAQVLADTERERAAAAEQLAATEQQRAHIAHSLVLSEKRRTRIARALSAGLAAVLAIAVVIAIIAVQQRNLANGQRRIAISRELAASALAQLQIDPALSVLLATQAGRTEPTAEAANALRQALVASHVRLVDRTQPGAVTSAAYSPDGRLVITGTSDGNAGGGVRIWEAATGRTLFERTGSAVLTVAFSPDGSLAVWGGADDRAHVWAVRTRTDIATLSDSDTLMSATFSPNSQLVVTTDPDGKAIIWNARSGRRLPTLDGQNLATPQAFFSPGGDEVLMVGPDQAAHLWRWSTSTMLHTLAAGTTTVDSAAFILHGTRIVTGHSDGAARVWDAYSGKLIRTLQGHAGTITSIASLPTAGWFVTTGVDGTARVWDSSTLRLVHVLSGHTGVVLSAAISPDGRLIATAGADNTVRLWDAQSGAALAVLRGHTNAINVAVFSPRAQDQTLLTASQDGSTRIWDVSTQARLNPPLWHAGTLSAAAWSADGTMVATAQPGGGIGLRSASSGAILGTLDTTSRPASALAFSPDGKLLAGIIDGAVDLFSVSNRRLVTILPANGTVTSFAFSADGKSVGLTLDNGTASIWSSGGAFETLLKDPQYGHDIASIAAFSPDGSRLGTIGSDGRVTIWDVHTGLALFSPSGFVSGLSFSPDGQWLLRVKADTPGGLQFARLSDAQRGSVAQTIDQDPNGNDDVTTAVFTADGSAIITARKSGLVRTFQGRTWTPTSDLTDHAGPVLAVTVSNDGAFLATAGADGSVRVWDRGDQQNLATWSDVPFPATAVSFSADHTLLYAVHTQGKQERVDVYRCRLCGTVPDLLSLAQERITRPLTPEERARYLQQG